MKIPTRVKIGKNWVKVDTLKYLLVPDAMGAHCSALKYIQIATHSVIRKTVYRKEEIANTFWHELTHAILHDMKHKLETDEKFVTAFADRLTQAVNSARFD